MKINLKVIGGILLIVGTSLGGGMLALPIGTAASGFLNTAVALLVCWLAMTICAFYILEVNLCLPKGANMISMAEKTLGPWGKMVTWLTYLLLLYALLAAYISGGDDIFQSLLKLIHINLPPTVTTILYVACFSAIVYTGIKAVDRSNSLLMYIKLFAYLMLLFLIFPHVSAKNLQGGNWHYLKNAAMLLITSYGFAIIVPSLRDYFNDDVKKLKFVIFVGSLFPLICYLAWLAAIMGVVPAMGKDGLLKLLSSGHETSGLATALEHAVHQKSITNLFRLFSSISMLTAFLGVSLCLFDFLSDGLNYKKKGIQGMSVNALVFLPPLVLVLFKPGIYISALQYAGILCVILLLLLPALMAYKNRAMAEKDVLPFITPGGNVTILTVIFFSICLLAYGAYAFIA